MKILKYNSIILLVITILSCKNEVKRIDSNNELNSSTQSNESVAIKNKKFAYVVFILESPRLEHSEPTYMDVPTPSGGSNYKKIDGYDIVVWDKKAFTTGIVEIEDYNEDEKFKLLDKAEYEYKQIHYPLIDATYESNVLSKVRDFQIKEEFRKHRTKIISRDVYAYDSYAEASKSKNKYQ
ncbi:hypothetical protein CLV33_101142 [Jejuia pallidilutea]|uniref:Lipoprotein n=1 Tax=Jejuia pallidilutea TaxID=504487 RepID=A0A362XDC3_9FLAO|nr:hypothetical protein CLV33_101142 [Jejuia pallidilutea]